MAATAAMPIAADTLRCRFISSTPLFLPVVRIPGRAERRRPSRRAAGLLPGLAPRPGSWTSRTRSPCSSGGLRIEGVAQSVAEEVERHDRDEDRDARSDEVGRVDLEVAAGVAEHLTP